MKNDSFQEISELCKNESDSLSRVYLDSSHTRPEVSFFSSDNAALATLNAYTPKKDTRAPSDGLSQCGFLYFGLSSAVEIHSTHDRAIHHFAPGQCVMGIVQEGAELSTLYQADQNYHHAGMYLNMDFVSQLLPDTQASGELSAERAQDFFSVLKAPPIDHAQLLILRDLFYQNAYQGRLRALYQESKLLELLCLTADKLSQTLPERTADIGSKDVTALHLARKILLEDLANPPSLKQLAALAGINEFKLKKGFKQLFGQTVYGMLHEVRLLEAKQLIEKDDIGVYEAAQRVGYNNASHFSKIFKSRFGMQPKQLRKQTAYFL